MWLSKSQNKSQKKITVIKRNRKSFKLATYNIQGVNPEEIGKNILHMKSEGVKIFCLQELRHYPKKKFIGDTIMKTLGNNWSAEYYIQHEHDLQDLGLVVIWNNTILQLKSLEKIALPKLEKLTFLEKWIEKINGLTKEPLQRKALAATFVIGKHTMRIVNVHLDWQGGFGHRRKQLEFLVNTLKKSGKVSSEVICGDFNTTIDLRRISKEKKHIQAIFGQGFFDATYAIPWTMDIQRTLHANRRILHKILKRLHVNLHQKLDYIWANGVEVVETDLMELEGSDHLPIVATVSL